MPRSPPPGTAAVAFALALAMLAGSALAVATSAGPASAEEPLPLGEFTPTPAFDPTCPQQHLCVGFHVECPGLEEARDGFIALLAPLPALRGVVLLFSGGGGTGWWGTSDLALEFLSDLTGEGFLVAQVRWTAPWLNAASGEDAGPAHLGCRPATAMAWLHDTLWASLAPLLGGPAGRCGFCVTGNSAGGSQVSYALSHYGLEDRLDAVVPTSGPPHAAEHKGCLRNPGEESYWYGGTTPLHDAAYGFYGGGGPCALHDPAWLSRWLEEAVDTGGSDYVHPSTRIHFLWGALDRLAPKHGEDYAARLVGAGSPDVTTERVPDMGHGIVVPTGLAALREALLAR